LNRHYLEAGAPLGEELRGPAARHGDVGMLFKLVLVPPLRLRERLRIVVYRVPAGSIQYTFSTIHEYTVHIQYNFSPRTVYITIQSMLQYSP
jgi:hypothetical protein